jgi:hypothetical protein
MGQSGLVVTFSEPVSAATAAVAANYQISGGVTVSAASLSSDGFTATLTTSEQPLNTALTLTVTNVQDTAGNAVAANTTANFTSVSLLKGFALYERWQDSEGDLGDLTAFSTALDDGSARAPDVTAIVGQFGGPWGAADNYNARVRTYFTPPSNGNYVFFVAADDFANVYLSTDDNPANKKLIAQENGWSNQYQWVDPRSGGSGSLDDKRSDLFFNSEWGGPIALQAGKSYYMEARLNEGGGGDGVDVTFIKEGDPDPSNDAAGMTMKGDVIAWYESVDALPPVLTKSPDAAYTVAAGASITLSAEATGATHYQWQLNGKDIPGATSKDYVISSASPAHIGQYRAVASNDNGSVTTTDGKVLVTVSNPFVIEAEDFDYDNGKSKPEASTMPYTGGAYEGLDAVVGVDYGSNDGADSPLYRSLTAQNKSMDSNLGGQWGTTRAGAWDMTTSYKLGWADSGDWGSYTRTFPDATYEVFAALSNDNSNEGSINAKVEMVTAGAGTANQTIEALGTFVSNGSGAWGRNNLVRMSDASGNPKTVALSGQKTLRFTMGSGDFDYLLLIPTTVQPTTGFSSVAVSGSNLVLAWTSGTLESADSVTGPWTAVANATSPATIPMTGTAKFYRLK